MAAGAFAVVTAPSAMAIRNAAYIPAWIPMSLAVVLIACSACCVARQLVMMALAATWSLIAGAFAGPALRSAGWIEPSVEWLAAPLIVALLCAIRARSLPAAVRVASACAVVAAALPYVAHATTNGQPSPGVAALTYTSIAALAVMSASAAHSLRTY